MTPNEAILGLGLDDIGQILFQRVFEEVGWVRGRGGFNLYIIVKCLMYQCTPHCLLFSKGAIAQHFSAEESSGGCFDTQMSVS